jgi:hypothetical protein
MAKKSKQTKKSTRKPFTLKIEGEGISVDVQLANAKNLGEALGGGISNLVNAIRNGKELNPEDFGLPKNTSPEAVAAAEHEEEITGIAAYLADADDNTLNQIMVLVTEEQTRRGTKPEATVS